MFRAIFSFVERLFGEHLEDVRANKAMIYDAIVKNSAQMNQIILTASVAVLAAIAALHEDLFGADIILKALSFTVLALFVGVILLSVINLHLTHIALRDIQKKFTENLKTFKAANYGMENPKCGRLRKFLNGAVFISFCTGLILFVVVLGVYIFGGEV